MKITRRDLGVIMILVGILSVFLVYQMNFKDMQTQVEALQEEQKNLKTQIDDLQPVKDNAPFYTSMMERFKDELTDIVAEFPVNILYEDGIMYVVELEENEDFNVSIPSFTVSEAAVSQTVEGAGSLTGLTYTLGQSTMSFSYTADSYQDMKDFVDYVYSDVDNKRTITNVSMVFDNTTGEVSGSVNINMYVMSDGSSAYEQIELPLDSLGVENIFGEVQETEADE